MTNINDNYEQVVGDFGNKVKGLDTQIKDMAKDVLLEDGKLYLKKSDGTKLGTGVILPISGSGGSVAWESITSKPTTFTPSSHSHSKSDITDFPTIPTGSEFKKVIETTFGEDCYAFTVTQDKDGNPLQLKEGIICVTVSQPKNTETQISFGVGFLDWTYSYNGRCSIYNVALMRNYEFYRLHVYFKIINNKVLAINLGTIRTGTVAPSFNNFDSVSSVAKVDMSSFRTLQNNYIDKIVIGLDMANTGLISGDSILEVWSI